MPRHPKPKRPHPVIQTLIHRREFRGWTRQDVADSMGCSYDAVYGWETGIIHPTFARLLEWCVLFDLKLVVEDLRK
jgi:transcriptional regulator with XRE-family HTH domain